MGNCVERYSMRPTEMMKQQQHEEERKRSSGGLVKKIIDTSSKEVVNINGTESQRMKIVVTKEELKWLIFELNEKGGGMRMEQVLEEIEKGRSGKVLIERWKPSLETIIEAPAEILN